MSNGITPEQDERNKRLIAHTLYGAQLLGIYRRNPMQEMLLNEGTPEERQVYVARKMRLYGAIAVLVLGYMAYGYFSPGPARPLPVAPEMVDAGMVKDVQLHDSTFTTSTTVTTSVGVYQVHGGVSASAGDSVKLKIQKEPIPLRSLCVESQIKSVCYSLL
ncbi:MAG: hypothetical protein V4713_03940 [Pseudomonadota bacterium]